MKQIIKILLINLILVSLSFSKINYYSNESADIILDVNSNKIIFFAFGGSFDGKAEDFPINSILKKNEKGEYVGKIEDLYLSESNGYVYKMDNKINEINIEINEDRLKVNQLDCFGTCPLFSNFLGIYIKKEKIPEYLIKIFRESSITESDLLYSMKQQLLENEKSNQKISIANISKVFNSNILADALAPTEEEYNEIVNSFKLIDTSKKELSKTYKINGEKIKVELQKQEDEQFQWVQHIITKYKPYETTLGEPNEWVVVNKYDQKLLSVVCIAPDKKTVLVSIARSSDYYKKKKQKLVIYSGYVAGVDKDSCCGNYWIDGGLLNGENPTAQTQIPNYNPKEFYPYFNEKRILERLYETNTCDKELTEKANIEVFVNGKWLPQEESWNIPNIDYVIKFEKQYLYKEPNENTKTKMYLVKNDVVEIMEEKDDWIYILYITKDNKEIKAWIPKNALINE